MVAHPGSQLRAENAWQHLHRQCTRAPCSLENHSTVHGWLLGLSELWKVLDSCYYCVLPPTHLRHVCTRRPGHTGVRWKQTPGLATATAGLRCAAEAVWRGVSSRIQ
jgi:hypothetical protein